MLAHRFGLNDYMLYMLTRIFIGKTHGCNPNGAPILSWTYNIKMDLKYIDAGNVSYIE